MEIVILDDMVATFNTTWARVANTSGHEQIKPGDEFKENGALEEFSVEATSFSPVPGASRIRLLRAHHSTKPEVHKAGAVLSKTNFPAMGMSIVAPVISVGEVAEDGSQPFSVTATVVMEDVAAKRGRGRPKGSPNKPKSPLVPAWPGVN